MTDLSPAAIADILDTWDAPVYDAYDGSQDVRPWLESLERLFEDHGIPPTQMADMAIKCTTGETNLVLTAMLEANVNAGGADIWLWTDFKECVIQIEDHLRGAPQGANDESFRSQHPYVAAALAVSLIGAGSAAVLPAATVGILGAIGFGSGGVVAGSIAAGLQSVIYGGATGGLFAVFQSLGATMAAPPLFATLTGFGAMAAGWFGFGPGAGEDPPADESDHDEP